MGHEIHTKIDLLDVLITWDDLMKVLILKVNDDDDDLYCSRSRSNIGKLAAMGKTLMGRQT